MTIQFTIEAIGIATATYAAIFMRTEVHHLLQHGKAAIRHFLERHQQKINTTQRSNQRHTMNLGYTNHDDGAWLRCTCGERIYLGFDSTAAEAAMLEALHLVDAGFTMQDIHDRQIAAAKRARAIFRKVSNKITILEETHKYTDTRAQ